MLKKLLVSAMGAAALIATVPASAVEVGLELALLVDVSGSVDDTEYALQKTGYVNAFNNSALWTAIAGSQRGKIAVTYIEWGGAAQQSQVVGWSLIDSEAAMNDFADDIAAASRAFTGGGVLTAPGSAINFALPKFGTETGGTANGFESLRQVIDVSGDGEENNGADTSDARDAALLAGVDAINGLPIGGSALETWYNDNIKGGTGAFVIAAADFDDFEAAVLKKLQKEITVPEPASLALVGLGLLGAGLARRRAQKA